MSKPKPFVLSAPEPRIRAFNGGIARAGRTVLYPARVGAELAAGLELQARLLTSVAEGWDVDRADSWEMLVRALRAAAAVLRQPQVLPAAMRRRIDAVDPGLLPAETLHLSIPKLRKKLRRIDRLRALSDALQEGAGADEDGAGGRDLEALDRG